MIRHVLMTLSGSALALTAICLAAGNEPAPTRPTEKKSSAQTAPDSTAKGADKPTAKTAAKTAAPAASKDPTASAAAEDKNAADEQAIRETGETFAKAYAKGDATALAAHFTADAEYVDERGNVFQGR